MTISVKILSILLFVSLAFSSCKKEESIDVTGNQEFTLENLETKQIKNGSQSFTLTYAELVEDSRCPEGMHCVWAGRVIIKLTDNHNVEHFIGMGDLKAGDSGIENQIEINEFHFRLVSLGDNGTITLEVMKI